MTSRRFAMARSAGCLALVWVATQGPALAAGPVAPDPRLREVTYDPHAIVTVPVKRGVVALVMLDPEESITDVAAGLGSDCSKPEAPWCVAAQPGGHTLFVKAKSTARAPNNLAVVTDRRTHSFRFVVLADQDATAPVYRLIVRPPAAVSAAGNAQVLALAALTELPAAPAGPSPEDLVAQRLSAKATMKNTAYSMAEGQGSQDIVPTLVYDDGRFTYLRFPGNREVPAVFHVQPDGSETLLNTHMEDDLLVVDRVSRRLMLRAGSAVVGLWNDAFDLEGSPPVKGTTVPGVERVLKAPQAPPGLTQRISPTTAQTGGAP